MFRCGALSQIYSGSLERATIGDMEVSREAVRVCKKSVFSLDVQRTPAAEWRNCLTLYQQCLKC